MNFNTTSKQVQAQAPANLQLAVNEFDVEKWSFKPEYLTALLKDIDAIVVVVEGGGMSPLRRRAAILSKYMVSKIREDLAFFVAVHLKRGQAWRKYAMNNDSFSGRIRSVAEKFMISTKVGDGRKSSQSAAIALSDVMIRYRRVNRVVMYSSGAEVFYEGICPQEYCWLGSLGAMFTTSELTDEYKEEDLAFWLDVCWIGKTLLYADYLSWYIQVASETSKKTFTGDPRGWLKSLVEGMHYAWSAWSTTTRQGFTKDSEITFSSPSPSMIYPKSNGYASQVEKLWDTISKNDRIAIDSSEFSKTMLTYFNDNIEKYKESRK
jgi:hypothetical protein